MPNEYSAFFTEDDDHVAANTNLAGVADVTPQQAIIGIDGSEIMPPDAGMRAPEVVAPLAAERKQSQIVAENPHVRQWAATAAPASLAATKDDFPSLATIGKVAVDWFIDRKGFDDIEATYFANRNKLVSELSTAAKNPLAPWNPLPAVGALAGAFFSPFAGIVEPVSRAVAKNDVPLRDVYLSGPNANRWWEQGNTRAPLLTNYNDRLNRARQQTDAAIQLLFGVGYPAMPGMAARAGAAAAEGGAATGGAPKPPAPVTPRDAVQGFRAAVADVDVAQVVRMQEAVAASQTHSRTPQVMEEYLAQQTNDATVEVDPDTLIELAQGGEVVFPGLEGEIAAAAADGTSLEVPLSRYVAATAGNSSAQALNDTSIFRADGVSVAEAKEFKPVEVVEKPLTEAVVPSSLTPEEAPRYRTLAAAHEAAVDEVVADLGIETLFKDAKSLGMADSQFERYGAAVDEAIASTRERMLARAERQILRERQPDWRDRVEQHFAAVELEVANDPVLRAWTALTTGKDPLGAPLEATKLALGDDIALYGRGLGLPKSMFRREGLSADEAAEVFGFPTGADMLRALSGFAAAKGELTTAQYVKQQVRAAAEERTREELGFDVTPEAIREAALEAFTETPITNFLASELKTLAEAANLPFDKDALVAYADARFASLNVKDAVNLKKMEKYVYRGGVKAEKALLKGDLPLAFIRKQQQFIHHLMLKDAFKFTKEYAKAGKAISRYAKNKSLSGMSQPYLDHIHDVLRQYNINVKRDVAELERGLGGQTTEAFIESKRDLGQDIPFPTVPAGDLKALTVAQFRDVNDMLTALASYGRAEEKLVVGDRRLSMEEARTEVVDQAAKLPDRVIDKSLVPQRKLGDRTRDFAEWIDAEHTAMESLFLYMDNGDPRGIFTRVLTNGSRDAANTFDRLEREVLWDIIQAGNHLPKALRKTFNTKVSNPIFKHPATGELLDVYRGDLIMVAANLGTASNAAKLAGGYGIDDPAVIVDWLNASGFTKEEANFVQLMWDKLSVDVFPQADAVARGMRGYGMTKLEASPLTLGGVKLKGGYWPVHYNTAFVRSAVNAPNVDIPDAMEKVVKPFRALSTPTGFEQERTNFVGPIDLSLDKVLQSHLRDVFTRIAYAKFAQNARRFITDKTVKAAVTTKAGPRQYEQMMPWLEDQIMHGMQYRDPAMSLGKALTTIRSNVTMSVLAFNASVGLKQWLGVLPATQTIGPKWMASGAKSFYYAAVRGGLDKHPIALSEEMRYRFDAIDVNLRELRDGFNSLDFTKSTAKRVLEELQRIGMAYIGWMDKYTVSGATWTGAFQKAKQKWAYTDADAVAYADQVVRRTQGASRRKDLLALQRSKNEGIKMLSMMFTWPGRQYNLIRDAANEIRTGNWKSGSYNLFWLLVIAPIVTAWVQSDLPDPKDAKDGDWAKLLLALPMKTLGESTVLTRDITGAAFAKLVGRPAFGPSSPIERLYDKVNRAIFTPLFGKKHKPPKASAVVDLVGTLIGAPGTAQAVRAVKIAEAKKKPQNPLEWYEALVSGAKKGK